MAQHEVLKLIAAPLVALGRPLAVFLWAFLRAGAGGGHEE
jgi:cytochrome c oxidase assembly factor CtaG